MALKVFSGTVFIIDPLGPRNERPYDDTMFNIINTNGMKHKFYNGSMQYDDGSICGWFAIFLCKVINQINPQSIGECEKLIDQIFGRDRKPDDGDLEVLIKAFGTRK